MEKVLAGTLMIVTSSILLLSVVFVLTSLIPDEGHVMTWSATTVMMIMAALCVFYKAARTKR
ncbi:hypothetical protein [Paenibacillus sp. 1001270B_150601_E10]|uniref:hypothetical protein n=1 Tax=Paenibacillus sp. 1001270B_150601_E10 TaxID=2787079 RepID=UPI00189F8E53|nr:hypothetical protein [Paenibacillus sp. 1001270B_150601_E10]